MLDHDFVMNMFSPICDELLEFDKYLDFYLEEKERKRRGKQTEG